MLESLTDRLTGALRNIRGKGRLTEDNMAGALKEVRSALLSADVHFKVARSFVERVREQSVGREVIKSVDPGQQFVKVIHDELVKLLGEGTTELAPDRPLRIMLVGLQGSGKTTVAGKLARRFGKETAGGQPVTLVAGDVYRPAAIDQLERLADETGAAFFADRGSQDVPEIGKAGLKFAKDQGARITVFDTAGRLQIDDAMVEEVKQLKTAVQPHEILLVADAALGQEAVNVARTFNDALGITGIVLTKMDGDARGGAALSMKEITGVPIKFMGTGEKLDALEAFHPDRVASRILGMGDVVSLVEKAQETIDQDEAEKAAQRLQSGEFNLEDMLTQMRQVKKMGSLGSLVSMLPGMSNVEVGNKEEKQVGRTEAIILSMTPKERQNPNLLRGSRVMRVARGSGTSVRDVNGLLKQYSQMRKMMRMMKGKKGKKMRKQMEAMQAQQGGSGPGGGLPDLKF
ncbi:MAG: signal recognition particle protein [Opitutales bacterium]